ncbi:MAG TPA: hypothetical protein VFZ21_04195 [Gemmatimonadaceae bacterium]|nr:hypothetical protein [Gemmatimonadaceae bacterium]
MADDSERPRPPDTRSRLLQSRIDRQEAKRARVFDAIEATFPPPATATPDELVQMAVHALGFDARSLAAAFGIARSDGEKLMRSPSSLTRRQRSLLAQYLEMGEDSSVSARHRSIAAKLRESIAADDQRGDADPPITPAHS